MNEPWETSDGVRIIPASSPEFAVAMQQMIDKVAAGFTYPLWKLPHVVCTARDCPEHGSNLAPAGGEG